MTTSATRVVALLCAAACGSSNPASPPNGGAVAPDGSAQVGAFEHIQIPAGLSTTDREAAQRARAAFLAACGSLNWSEFQEVSLITSNAHGYMKEKFDWELMVTIVLTYKEGLDLRRGGHRLTFDMGAGSRPGIVTRKSHAIRLCSFEHRAVGVSSGEACDPDAGEDCILEVHDLKALDASRPRAVVDSDRKAPLAWCFAHGFDPPAFWTCAGTSRACRMSRSAVKRDEHGDYKIRSECAETTSLHCFTVGSGRTLCAPDAAACSASRNEWTNMNTAAACEVATPEMLVASTKP